MRCSSMVHIDIGIAPRTKRPPINQANVMELADSFFKATMQNGRPINRAIE